MPEPFVAIEGVLTVTVEGDVYFNGNDLRDVLEPLTRGSLAPRRVGPIKVKVRIEMDRADA